MNSFSAIYESISRLDVGDITTNQKKAMREALLSVSKSDLANLEDHKRFLLVLNKFRSAVSEDVSLQGQNFLDTIKKMLSVGEDGVYSNRKRFLYELIQNVDDCEYLSNEDCSLVIQFDYFSSPGRIILTYNETGFSPQNVFSITGIAEESKNISQDKLEIGEKGIGFKSVFGIAEKVYIESGYFSFFMDRENFTVPVPCYDNFEYVSGSRMTLIMPNSDVKAIFRSIIEQYKEEESVLNQNPILFLNKLTHIKMIADGFRYVEFSVKCKGNHCSNGLISIEQNVVISADMKDYTNGIERVYSVEVPGIRCTMPVQYGLEECVSRYGDKISFDHRDHRIIAFYPYLEDKLEKYDKGLLYSFLPTQIKVNAPFVIHVPFKLDGSREFVDPQGNNSWFQCTIEKLELFLKEAIIEIAKLLKQKAVYYIPSNDRFIFFNDNQKIDCLCVGKLRAGILYREKIFYCESGCLLSAQDVIAFPKGMKSNNLFEIYGLLDCSKHLFVPDREMEMSEYGCETIHNPYVRLFEQGLKNDAIFSRVVDIIEENQDKFEYGDVLARYGFMEFSESQLCTISKTKSLHDAVQKLLAQYVEKQIWPWQVDDTIEKVDNYIRDEIVNLITNSSINECVKTYLKTINYNILCSANVESGFCFAGRNGLVVSREVFDSLCNFVKQFDKNRSFQASLLIRQASRDIDDLDDSIDNNEYLAKLREYRKVIKNSFGDSIYGNYIRLITEAGVNEDRFLYELLQNADDCEYSQGNLPELSLSLNQDELVIEYNEIGFSKANVRAITAIGESTKNNLLNGKNEIGEKGIGFKSVFSIADEVEIHSNGFHFRLRNNTPTIPEKCEPVDTQGTLMRFKLSKQINKDIDESTILQMCTCLRKLKNLNIFGHKLLIVDRQDCRSITIGKKHLELRKYSFNAATDDHFAISERYGNKNLSAVDFTITCYSSANIPKYLQRIYTGLPTEVLCNIPLIIDAPFELSTSRTGILHDRRWNDIIKKEMYQAILSVMEDEKMMLRIDTFKYVRTLKDDCDSSHIFSDEYLNGFDLLNKLKQHRFFPLLSDNIFISSDDCDCFVLPDVLLHFGNSLSKIGCIIDTYLCPQYNDILVLLGAKNGSPKQNILMISENIESIVTNEVYRKELYDYLAEVSENGFSDGNAEIIKQMPIFPVKCKKGTSFVKYSNNIYFSENQVSDEEIYVLDTDCMEEELFETLTSSRLNELTQEVYDYKYQNWLCELLNAYANDTEEIAKRILQEYRQNIDRFSKCKSILRGRLDDIPMQMICGIYAWGKKCTNKEHVSTKGILLQNMVVSEDYEQLAEFLGCTDIKVVHYEDIDYDVESLADEDIEDLLGLKNFGEIIKRYIDDGLISDSQIEKFELEYFDGGKTDNDDCDEAFPEFPISDVDRAKRRVQSQFRINPNPYLKKQIIRWEPENPIDNDKKLYTVEMYKSKINGKQCFCQMCRKRIPIKYAEKKEIRENPKYAWGQLYLCLCSECSKDYYFMSRNKIIWNNFFRDIINAQIGLKGRVDIGIGGVQTISFTAKHLTEIQSIFSIPDMYEERHE